MRGFTSGQLDLLWLDDKATPPGRTLPVLPDRQQRPVGSTQEERRAADPVVCPSAAVPYRPLALGPTTLTGTTPAKHTGLEEKPPPQHRAVRSVCAVALVTSKSLLQQREPNSSPRLYMVIFSSSAAELGGMGGGSPKTAAAGGRRESGEGPIQVATTPVRFKFKFAGDIRRYLSR